MVRWLLLAVALVCVAGIYLGFVRDGGPAPDGAPPGDPVPRVLFLTASAGYVHEVVKRPAPDELSLAERELTAMLAGRFAVDCTQDPGVITAENLARYDVVAFYTTGELAIPEVGKQALLDYVRGGGGFAGIHPATDTFYEWPAYGDLIGGRFDLHPWHQRVRIRREDGGAFATGQLPDTFEMTDEIYQFKAWSRDEVHVLLSLDTESVDLGRPQVRREDGDFALSWWRPFGEGRVFYTALGHRPEVWQDERFRNHVTLGIHGVARGRAGKPSADGDGYVPLDRMARGAHWLALPLTLNPEGVVYCDPRESWRNLSLRARVRRTTPGDALELHLRAARGSSGATVVRLGSEVPADGAWHALEVVLEGRTVVVSVDGRDVARGPTGSRLVGHVGYRIGHDGRVWLDVKDLCVRRLPDEVPGR